MQKFAAWDENLASHTPDVQAAARALEALIREEVPDVVVQYDPGNALLAFGRSKRIRHVKVRSAEAARDDRIRTIVREQGFAAGP